MTRHHLPFARRRPSVPRAGCDPIDDAASALRLFSYVVPVPMCERTVVMPIDEHRLASTIVFVEGAAADGSIATTIATLAGASAPNGYRQLYVATYRPSEPAHGPDLVRWADARRAASEHGCELLEWFVFDGRLVWPVGALVARGWDGE